MESTNLYWPIYKNLEKEVLLLADSIHFCDEQIDVYSVKIAELLFRISAENESLIKDLFRIEKHEEPKNPGVALNMLNDLWMLDQKLVILSAPNMYFSIEENKKFTPFKYSNSDKNDYYSAYNAVKHDRVKNISKASIRVLIRGLATLFLLNLYFISEPVIGVTRSKGFDSRLGSDMFSIKPYWRDMFFSNTEADSILPDISNDSTYIIKYTDQSYRTITRLAKECTKMEREFLKNSLELKQYLSSGNPFPQVDHVYSVGEIIGGWCLKQVIYQNLTFEEQEKALVNSSEFKIFASLNSRLIPDKLDETNIEKIILLVGGYAFNQKFKPFEYEYMHSLSNSPLEAILNKNERLYQKPIDDEY